MWSRLSQAAGFSPDVILQDEEQKNDNSSSNIEDQMQVQNHTIEELKVLLRESENQLKEKEKELDVISLQFSHFQIESKAKINGLTNKLQYYEKTASHKKGDVDFDDSSSTDFSDQMAKGKIILLSKKLKTANQLAEKKEKEMQDISKNYEHKIAGLETQLTEYTSLVESLSNKKELSQIEFCSTSEKSVQEMHAQTVLKDCKIQELNDLLLEQERKTMDLQEYIKNKNEVLKSKDNAHKLMTNDMGLKLKAAVDELEDSREQMKKMQINFSDSEINLKECITSLKKELSCVKNEFEISIVNKDNVIQCLRENLNKTEILKCELITDVADLKKKLVLLETNTKKNKGIDQLNEIKVKTLNTEVQTEVTELNTLEQIDQLHSEISNFKIALEIKHKDIVHLEFKLKDSEEENASTIQKIKEMESYAAKYAEDKIHTLEETVKELRLNNQSYVDEIASITNLKTELEKFERKYKCSEKEKEELMVEVDNLKCSISYFTSELNAQQNIENELKQNYNKAKTFETELNFKCENLLQKIHELEQKICLITSENNDVKHENNILLERLEKSVENLSECKLNMSNFNTEIIKKEQDLKFLMSSIELCKHDLTTIFLTTNVENIDEFLNVWAKQIEELQKIKTDFKITLMENTSLFSELEKNKKERSLWQDKIQEIKLENSEIKDMLSINNQEKLDLKQNLKIKCEQQEQLLFQCNALKKQLKEIKCDLNDKNSQISIINVYNDEKIVLQEEIENKNVEIQNIKTTLAETTQCLKEEIRHLTLSNSSLNLEFLNNQRLLSQKTDELNHLKELHSNVNKEHEDSIYVSVKNKIQKENEELIVNIRHIYELCFHKPFDTSVDALTALQQIKQQFVKIENGVSFLYLEINQLLEKIQYLESAYNKSVSNYNLFNGKLEMLCHEQNSYLHSFETISLQLTNIENFVDQNSELLFSVIKKLKEQSVAVPDEFKNDKSKISHLDENFKIFLSSINNIKLHFRCTFHEIKEDFLNYQFNVQTLLSDSQNEVMKQLEHIANTVHVLTNSIEEKEGHIKHIEEILNIKTIYIKTLEKTIIEQSTHIITDKNDITPKDIITALKKDFESAKLTISELNEKKASFQKLKDEFCSKLKLHKDETSDFNKKLLFLEETNKEYVIKQTILESDIENMQNQYNNLEQQYKESKNSLVEYNALIKTLTTENKSFQERLENCISDKNNLSTDIKNYEKRENNIALLLKQNSALKAFIEYVCEILKTLMYSEHVDDIKMPIKYDSILNESDFQDIVHLLQKFVHLCINAKICLQNQIFVCQNEIKKVKANISSSSISDESLTQCILNLEECFNVADKTVLAFIKKFPDDLNYVTYSRSVKKEHSKETEKIQNTSWNSDSESLLNQELTFENKEKEFECSTEYFNEQPQDLRKLIDQLNIKLEQQLSKNKNLCEENEKLYFELKIKNNLCDKLSRDILIREKEANTTLEIEKERYHSILSAFNSQQVKLETFNKSWQELSITLQNCKQENDKLNKNLSDCLNELQHTKLCLKDLNSKHNEILNENCTLKQELHNLKNRSAFSKFEYSDESNFLVHEEKDINNQIGIDIKVGSQQVVRSVHEQHAPINELPIKAMEQNIGTANKAIELHANETVLMELTQTHQRLLEAEKICRELKQTNEAINSELVIEIKKRQVLEEELGYEQQELTSNVVSSQDECHLLLEDFPKQETVVKDFSITHSVKSHGQKLHRILSRKKNYFINAFKRKKYSKFLYLIYMFAIHIWVFVCLMESS